MKAWQLCAAFAAMLVVELGGGVPTGRAAEPNETFETATSLGAGILTVVDTLTPGFSNEPDTLLGFPDFFGDVQFADDNGSIYGNGLASGAFGVEIPFGTIEFAVTGYPNFSFNSLHDENGAYRVYVEVYNESNIFIEQFAVDEFLAVDEVDGFSFFDNAWVNGTYNVNIDNVVPCCGDVDFYRFTGLTAGAAFAAETWAPVASTIDTYLGWFDASGTLLDADDDGADGNLSKLEGVVPAGGSLILAVTGTGDFTFKGSHFENDPYELRLTLGGDLAADFDNSGGVRGADLALWKSNYGTSAVGDADADGDTDGADFLIWQRELGLGSGASASAATVPEPSCAAFAGLALLCHGLALRRR